MLRGIKSIVFFIGLLTVGFVWAEPVAMVTDVDGGVSLITGKKSSDLELLSYLEPGMKLKLDANSYVSATLFANPIEYRFNGPANLTVTKNGILADDGKSKTHAVSLQKSSAAKKFIVANRESVAQASYTMRGIKWGLRLADPVDTQLLDGNAVNFSWEGPRSKQGYHLSVYQKHGKLLHQTNLDTNSWAAEPGLLKRGQTYQWEVKTELETGEEFVARGSFSVAAKARADAVQAQKFQPGASFSGRVLYAVFLEQQGFKYDARQLWSALAKERPSSIVAKEHATR